VSEPVLVGEVVRELVELVRGRYVVDDNDSACDGCGRVTAQAVVDVSDGIPMVA
jgi:hypothetical protein